jgi:hypothetical protein
MNRRFSVLFAISALSVIGCRSRAKTTPVPSARAVGTYNYLAHLGPYDEMGTFTITADSVSVEPRQSLCIEDPAKNPQLPYREFTCSGSGDVKSVSLSIHLDKPTVSRWHSVQVVPEVRRECVRDSVPPSGGTICLRFSTYEVGSDKYLGDRLLVTPVKLGQPPAAR